MSNLNKKKEVKKFIENLTVRQYEDFRRKVLFSCSVTRATYSNWRNGKTVPKHYHEKINAIAQEITGNKIFSDQNGEGEMLKSETSEIENIAEDAVVVPYVDRSSARERNLSVRKILNTDTSIKQIHIYELFDPVDFYKKMHDDSMSETIQQGDYLFIKLLPRDANLVNGSIYLIDTKSYGILVRKVLVVDAETYELIPINETYGKITIKRDDIIDFGVVVHLLRSSFHVPNSTIQTIASESTKQVSSLIDEL